MDSNGDDPQTLLISTLRSQISDLFTQVTQLNGKLVQSYDRVSDLEDEIHSSSLSLRQASVKVSQLELERTQHLSALNTGLLVEKEVVTQELTRLMEKATEEAASRGLAESAKTQIEKELDDLSASLFSQANTMVAEARFARSLAEEKARSAEVMLKGAEEAVGVMQGEVRRLVEEKENKEKELERLRGRGKYRAEEMSSERVMMRTGNVGYTEFLAFVGHLRTLKATKATHPTMNTLLGLPFLARLMNEDSDPTIRLDLAPSLNWLSRRTVLAAIHNGNLTIEPVQTAVLLQQLSSSISSGPSTLTTTSTTGGVCCALCGSALFASDAGHHHENQGQATSTRSNSIPNVPVIGGINGIGIGSTWFKRPSTPSNATTGTPTPPPSPPPPHLHSNAKGVEVQLPTQVYIFRVTNTSATGSSAGVSSGSLSVSIPKPSSFSTTQAPPPPARTGRGRSGTVSQSPAPAPSSSQSNSHSGTLGIPNLNSNTNTIGGPGGPIYPLCTSNYCLARLRATCSLWAFVRVGVVTAVWEEAEELGSSPTTSTNRLTPPPTHPSHPSAVPPAIPPRRRGLWGTLGSLSERAAGWSSSSQSSRPGTPTAMEITEKEKGLPSVPPPPPLHPSIATATTTTTTTTTGAGAAPPPPLPKRNEGRGRRAMTPVPASVPSESESQHVTADVVKGAGTGEVVFTASPPSSPNVLPSVPKEPHLLPLPDSRPPTPQTPTATATTLGARPPPPLPRRAVARDKEKRASKRMSGAGVPEAQAQTGERVGAEADTTEVVKEADGEGIVEGHVDTSASAGAGMSEIDAKAESPKSESETKTETDFEEAQNKKVEAETKEESEMNIMTGAGAEVNDEGTKVEEGQANTEEVRSGAGVEAKEEANPGAVPVADGQVAAGQEEEKGEGVAVIATQSKALENAEDIPAATIAPETKDPVSVPELTEAAHAPSTENSDSITLKQALDTSTPPPLAPAPPPTWEERTWKELVRLREVMFWARVGVAEA